MSKIYPITATLEFHQDDDKTTTITPSFTGTLSVDHDVHKLFVMTLTLLAFDRPALIARFLELRKDEDFRKKTIALLAHLDDNE